MPRRHRLIFLALCFATLIGVGFGVTGSFDFFLSDFWFSCGLLMLILLSIVDQPHFSRDGNIFLNGVAAMISLVTVAPGNRPFLWYVFLVWALYLVASSFLLMYVRTRELVKESLPTRLTSRINREIGRPQAVFSAFFLWGIFEQFGPDSAAFRALLLYWAVFIILNLPSVAQTISSALETPRDEDEVDGVITNFYSPRVFECRLRSESARLKPGARMTVHAGDGRVAAHATVIDDRVMPNARYAKLVVTEVTDGWPRLADESSSMRTHVRLVESHPAQQPPTETESSPSPIGVVNVGTNIGTLNVLVNPNVALKKGEVLGVVMDDSKEAFYQIVSAKVTQETFEASSQGLQNVMVNAGQLGVWDSQCARFEPITWVPPAGGAVLRTDINDAVASEIPDGCLTLGSVPNSYFPVHLDLEGAVTHNTAIVGVTGSGKTYLALHIVEALVAHGVRVLILDLSRQHWVFLDSLNPTPISSVNDVSAWLSGNEPLGVHQFAPSGNYPRTTADFVSKVLEQLASTIQLMPGTNEPARVCVVIEEAHSLIPEWNQVASQGDTAHVNRTARAILQGRKYGLGCLLITQRTANVTKTILNQCNTIFACQSFDQTGLDFLKNYMGDEYSNAISTLPVRHAILVGKASSSARPIIFEVTDFGNRWTSLQS